MTSIDFKAFWSDRQKQARKNWHCVIANSLMVCFWETFSSTFVSSVQIIEKGLFGNKSEENMSIGKITVKDEGVVFSLLRKRAIFSCNQRMHGFYSQMKSVSKKWTCKLVTVIVACFCSKMPYFHLQKSFHLAFSPETIYPYAKLRIWMYNTDKRNSGTQPF